MNNLSTCTLNKSLRILASSPAGTPTHLSINKNDAQLIVKALDKLSSQNASDLLSHGENEMVFLAKAVLENPKTAYAVLKQNHAFILEARSTNHSLGRLVKGLTKKQLLSKISTILKRSGLPSSKTTINITRVSLGQQVEIPIKVGTPYTTITMFRAELAKHYEIRGSVNLQGAGKDLKIQFTIINCKTK